MTATATAARPPFLARRASERAGAATARETAAQGSRAKIAYCWQYSLVGVTDSTPTVVPWVTTNSLRPTSDVSGFQS